MSNQRSSKSNVCTVSPFPLNANDVDFLAGTLVPLLLFAMIAIVSWQSMAQDPFVDLDDTPPIPAAFQVDLNSAEWPEIAQMPGIGETLARRIVAARLEDGQFKTVEQLIQIRGIGEKKLKAIRPFCFLVSSPKVVEEESNRVVFAAKNQ